VKIDYSLDIPIYEQVVQQIRQMIASGELGPGDTLPPVRQLASQLDVAANTIARAYQELANLDLIAGNRRRGSIVRRSAPVVSGQEVRVLKEAILKLIQQGKSRRDIEALFKNALHQIFD
jgi:GntR family transcriptional regulator